VLLMSAYDRFREAVEASGHEFREVRRTKKPYHLEAFAQCPAHDDHNPSLHVDDYGEGRIVVTCFARCPIEDVVTGLGLTLADLFDNQYEVRYLYEDGRVVHRRPGKRFRQSGNTQGSPAALYLKADVLAANGRGESIYVVEGETDVHAVKAAGGTATCSPMGAGKWDKVDASPLYQAREVIVCRDRDEAGHRHAAEVVVDLTGHVAVRLVEPKEGKDISDHLQRGYTLDDLVPVEVETEQDLLANLRTGEWLDRQVFPPLRWIVPGLVPEGASLLVGAPKSGKSWLALSLALAVAEGSKALDVIEVEQRPVLLLALEDGDRRLQDRSRALLHRDEDPANWQAISAWLTYLTRVKPNDIVPTVLTWLDRLDARGDYARPFVIVDTLGKVMPRALPGESDYQRDYRIGSELKAIPDERPGMSLLALHHDRKADAEDFVHSVSGTNGIAGSFDTVLVIRRKRLATTGTLQVTGRDVPEDEYAIRTEHGAWSLDGDDLAEAAKKARESHETGSLGERSQRILRLAEDNPQGIGPAAVAYALGVGESTARAYLSRLLEGGHLTRPERGVYRLPSSEGVASAASVASDPATQRSQHSQHPTEGES
jgi:5S rRNA maturation endonuclease (ribonuclease M5)